MTKSVFSNAYRLFLNELVQTRKACHITQMRLAESLRRPQSFVSKYESGERRLDIIEVWQILNAMNVNPKTFFENLDIHFKTSK